MPFTDDPAEMTREQRLAEVAAILAAAWLRHPFTEKPLDSLTAPMAVCVNGLTQRDPVVCQVRPGPAGRRGVNRAIDS
jgi:hypothetical protein